MGKPYSGVFASAFTERFVVASLAGVRPVVSG